MSKTSEQLIYEVAGMLGIAVAGEALGAVEHETISDAIDPVLSEVERIVHIGNRNEIPDEFFQTVARLVATHCSAKFSNAPVDLDQVQIHENRLRYLATSKRPYSPAKVQYF